MGGGGGEGGGGGVSVEVKFWTFNREKGLPKLNKFEQGERGVQILSKLW